MGLNVNVGGCKLVHNHSKKPTIFNRWSIADIRNPYNLRPQEM